MSKNPAPADNFFNDVTWTSIKDNIEGIYTSDGAISILLDFERVLEDCDIYAFKNWINGELVDGPIVGRYAVKATFMWPYKLMPDPRAALRLMNIGCTVLFAKSKIKVPVAVKQYDDFIQGTRYPKMQYKKVWYVQISVPIDLMDDVKEGSIDIADDEIDLSDIQDAYDEDLETDGEGIDTEADENQGEDTENSFEGGLGGGPPGGGL